MSELVTDTLRNMGPAGAAISVMLTAVTALVGAVVFQWTQANKVYGYRPAERDALNKALTDSSAAINAFTKIHEERNEKVSELVDVITRQTIGLEHLKTQFDDQKECIKDQTKVIGSLAEAVRTSTGILTDTRNYIQQLPRPRR
jgi:peptidoglycan hydrolase CwlO-like protein